MIIEAIVLAATPAIIAGYCKYRKQKRQLAKEFPPDATSLKRRRDLE